MPRTRAQKTASKPAPASATSMAVRMLKRAFQSEQTATQLLKSQHEEVKSLFERIESARTRAAKTKLFDELARKLVGHDAIEREIFYPACEREMGMTDLLGEALVEHGVVEFSLYQADRARHEDDFSFKCQVLSELVLHHVREEEHEFFPKVEKAFGKAKLQELAARMQTRFEQSQTRDFHGPLEANLKQVLKGSLKPRKSGKSVRGKLSSLPPKSGRRPRAA